MNKFYQRLGLWVTVLGTALTAILAPAQLSGWLAIPWWLAWLPLASAVLFWVSAIVLCVLYLRYYDSRK